LDPLSSPFLFKFPVKKLEGSPPKLKGPTLPFKAPIEVVINLPFLKREALWPKFYPNISFWFGGGNLPPSKIGKDGKINFGLIFPKN